jgi:hypothetical protein
MEHDYLADVKKYARAPVNEAAVKGIVKHLGIALRSRDASFVACSDKSELDRVKAGFCTKKLALSDKDNVDAALKAVCEKMRAARDKHRVTFYYLLAEHYGKLGQFAG